MSLFRVAKEVFANFIFPLEEALPKAEAEAEIEKENEEKARCEERVGQLADDKEELPDHFGECVQALEAEKARQASVEGRLTTIMGLASIAGTIVFGSILAQATGSIHPQRTGLRFLMAIGAAYLTAQIASAILAAVHGLSRRGYFSEKASEILPLEGEAVAIYFRRRIASILRILLDHQNLNGKKVTQMAVAHQAMKNFVWGLLAVALCGTVYGITAQPTYDVVEALRKNQDLVEIIQRLQSQSGAPGTRGDRAPPDAKPFEEASKSGDDAAATKMEEAVRRLDAILKTVPPPFQNSSHQNGYSSWATILMVVLGLGVAAGIIWMTLKLSPSKTPLAIAFALAGGMIEGAKHLPQPGGHKYYWWVIFFLLIAGAAIIVFGKLLREPGDFGGATASDPNEQAQSQEAVEGFKPRHLGFFLRRYGTRPESNSPLIIGFSILLLASTLAYLGKAPDKSPDKSSPTPLPCPANTPLSSMKFKEALHPVQGFGTGPNAAKTQSVEQFKRDLESKKFTEADLLVLLGSTDCISVKKNGSKWGSNQVLAQGRADAVRDAVSKSYEPPTIVNAIVSDALPQAESCSQALERRGVYPLLFRQQTSK